MTRVTCHASRVTCHASHPQIFVYALHVREELADYDEKNFRERRWFSADTAPERAARDAVKDMIRLLIDRARWLAG